MSRWNEQQSCKFVSVYKQCECLWNVFHSGYKNKQSRYRAFQQLVDAMGLPDFTVKDVAKKIRSFRSTYNQELAKIARSRKTGVQESEVYKPTLKWFAEMDFMMTNKNFTERSSTQDDTDLYYGTDEFNNPDEDSILTNVMEMGETLFYNDDAEEPLDTENVSNRPKKRKRQHTPRVPEEHDTSSSLLTVPSTSTLSVSAGGHEEDECDVIGRHVAMQLRQLSVEYMIDANLEIQNILAKYRKRLASELAGSTLPS